MKRKTKVIICGIIILLIISVCCYIGISETKNTLFGANMNSSSYGKDINSDVFNCIEDAYSIKSGNTDNETIIYQKESGNVHTVFAYGYDTNQYVICYEFIKNTEGYVYSGQRKLLINATDNAGTYTREDTLRADLSLSTASGYKNVVKPGERYDVLPAWGVSDYESIANVRIDGQQIDKVIEIADEDETYFLWIIYDLQTEKNAKDVEIDY